ncbi:putative aquaporin [Phytophthora cinnamomi]|uniref:putative aquaporin n=1 Tax=Phytophthora cinnamomi TaxID=4785 RepID=UPI003559FE48|nr:putative aquaporin [Phytophthora cinnamomi]
MAPLPSAAMATPDVASATVTAAQPLDDSADKVECGYAVMPTTPKAAPAMPFATASSLATKPQGLARFAVQSVHVRECLAEFLGTFVMIVFGMGVNNQVTNSQDANGTWLSINMCWGIGVLIGVYCSEGVSGANLNTAVTLAHCVYGRLPWWKAPGYMLSQLLGAFCGAFVIYVMQYQNLNVIDPHRETTQSSFATYPSANISNYTAFYTEFIGTAMLVLSIYAITDKRNRPAGPVGAPFAFCLMIMALGMAFGMNTGYAVNPARDFGPRLFTFCAGWGSKVFTTRSYYFWIPLVADSLGGVCGAGLYRVLVEIHHPQPQSPLL